MTASPWTIHKGCFVRFDESGRILVYVSAFNDDDIIAAQQANLDQGLTADGWTLQTRETP